MHMSLVWIMLYAHFKSHMCTHNGENPFKCYLCLLQFSLSGILMQHLHTPTGETPSNVTQVDYALPIVDIKRSICAFILWLNHSNVTRPDHALPRVEI